MENNNQLKIFRQKFLRNAKHAISARGSSVDQQNALAPIRRVGSCKEGVYVSSQKYILGGRKSAPIIGHFLYYIIPKVIAK